MTVDERIEKLTGRHEALAQTVELLAAQTPETSRVVAAIVAGIQGLARIAEAHESRFAHLEDS